jgi:hypothetical protein
MLSNLGQPAAAEHAREYYILAWAAIYCTFPARVATVSLVETLVRPCLSFIPSRVGFRMIVFMVLNQFVCFGLFHDSLQLLLASYEEIEGRDLHDPWRSWFTTGMAVRLGHSVCCSFYISRFLSPSFQVITSWFNHKIESTSTHPPYLWQIHLYFDFINVTYLSNHFFYATTPASRLGSVRTFYLHSASSLSLPRYSLLLSNMMLTNGASNTSDLSASRWNLSDNAVRTRQRICQSMFHLDTFIVCISLPFFP